jgi:hypothetical protein
LEYKPEGTPKEAYVIGWRIVCIKVLTNVVQLCGRLYFASKGIVYDTGGHDLKVGGIMAGMTEP